MTHVLKYISAALLTLIAVPSTFAHINLLSPSGGEELEVGSTFTITWQITIPHDTDNWDVFYSTVSGEGPWIDVSIDLPPGDPSTLSIHTYDWTVPDDVDDSVWVQVIMDTPFSDYIGINGIPFSIIAAACEGDSSGDGVVDVTDLLEVIEQWGALKSPADLNGDGIVNVTDLLLVVGNWGECV